MTREEAIEVLRRLPIGLMDLSCEQKSDLTEALNIALAALRGPTREQGLWHDAKTDPPETPGLYYGKKDDTNSMYACRYRDGVWVLDLYPQTEMDIVQWADYSAFVREGVEPSLRTPTREQVEAFRGEWIKRDGYTECSKCEYWYPSGEVEEEDDRTPFCPRCGAPMTDEAVEIVMERLEVLKDGSTD